MIKEFTFVTKTNGTIWSDVNSSIDYEYEETNEPYKSRRRKEGIIMENNNELELELAKLTQFNEKASALNSF